MSQAVVAKLKGAFAASVLEVKEHRGEVTVTVKKEDIVDICRFLKEEAGYNFLCDLCGVDYLGQTPPFYGGVQPVQHHDERAFAGQSAG